MQPADGEVAFEYQGATYTLKFDMKAIAFFEREADCSILQAMQHIARAQADPVAHPPKLSLLAYLVQAGLRRFHPEVDLDQAAAMIGDPEVQAALGTGMQSSMPKADGRSAEGNGQAAPKYSTGTPKSSQRRKPG
jgi:hypothetical protein